MTFEHFMTENLCVLKLFVKELCDVFNLPAKERAESINIKFVLLNAVVHQKVILNSGAGKTLNS